MRGQVEGVLEFKFFGRRDWIFRKEEFGVRGKFCRNSCVGYFGREAVGLGEGELL